MADPGQAARDGAGKAQEAGREAQRHPDEAAGTAAREIGRDVEQHPRAVAGGVATGAVGGAALGGPPGAVVGGVAGALRGLAAADVFDVLKKRLRGHG